MISAIYWDPNPEIFSIWGFPILWYSFLFALGFAIGFPIFVNVLIRFFQIEEGGDFASLKKKAVHITDRLVIYMVIATVVGARLGHFFFYENPSSYLKNPLEIFRFPIEGLASHGAIVAIILAVMLFSYRIRKSAPGLDWLRLLDFVAIPTALVGAFIRIGNFINQEILGVSTQMPWAVIFGHPADHSRPAPRHPVQIYEALAYLAIFFLLWRLSFRSAVLLKRGRLIGIFLVLVFGFRFIIEFLKTEQSHIVSSTSILNMGQYLSIPAILLGAYFLFRSRRISS